MADSNVKEILALRKQLEERDAERNNSYDEVLLNYGGSTYKDRKKKGFFPGIKSVVSSIFNPREDEEDGAALVSPINLTRPTILNKVAFMALIPQPRVIEPPEALFTEKTDEQGKPLSPADQAMLFADELEQVILGIWKFSNITRRCWDLAWNLGAFGGSVLGCWPDMQKERVRIFTRSPQDFYPVCIDEDGLELDRAVWVDELTGYDIRARYGDDSYMGRTDVKVTQYIDREKMCVILDDSVLAFPAVTHGLGFVPIVCVGNIGIPGSPWGDTDVKEAIPVSKEINYHMKLLGDMGAALINPTIAIRDPLNVPEDVAIGKGGKITMGAQGSVELLGPLNLPNSFWQLTDLLQSWYDLIADNPAQLRGEGFGSVLTGKGFNASLSPVAARLQTRLNLVLTAWEVVNRYALLMWKDMPAMNRKVKSIGSRGKNMYYIEKEPADFVLDGEIWTENEVILSSSSFIDRQGTDVELIQLAQNEYLSWETVVENLPYVTNKARERRRIDKDRVWKAEGMAISAAAANSPMTANTDLGSAEQTAYGLERGATGEVGPPAGPTAQMPPGAPTGPEGLVPNGPEGASIPPEGMQGPVGMEGDPASDPIAVLEQLFGQIQKLQGRVWIGGQPMLQPESVQSEDWKLTVWVEVPQDKGTITQFAKGQYPELYGHLAFVDGPPSGDEPSVQVAGEQQGEEMDPEEVEMANALPDSGPLPPGGEMLP